MKLFIDIGGTHLRSEIYTAEMIHREKLSSQEHDLADYIKQCLARYPDISFIGISFAGQVYQGEILSAPNIRITTKNIKEYFESCYPLRLEIDNDLNCAVMAEASYFQEPNIAALYIGTGLGAAVIDQGRLIRGFHNQAFELGHIPYKEAPFLCGCGKNNCVELFASGGGLEKRMRYNHKEGKPDLKKLKDQGDNSVELFEDALLHAAATLVSLANPRILVLGGGIVEQNPYLIQLLKQKIGTKAFPSALEGLTITGTALKNAGMDGAKLLERREDG